MGLQLSKTITKCENLTFPENIFGRFTFKIRPGAPDQPPR